MAFNDTTTVILLTNTASQSSQMSLYLTVPTAEDGEAPANIATLSPSLTPPVNFGFVTWEGNQITGNFTSHLGFTTQIQGNALSQPINTQVGTAYHAPPFAVPAPGQPPFGFNVFNIYKDNGRIVYTDPVLGAVSTIYYCVSAGTTVQQIPEFVPIP